jgi:hypothetical protein
VQPASKQSVRTRSARTKRSRTITARPGGTLRLSISARRLQLYANVEVIELHRTEEAIVASRPGAPRQCG